LDLQRMSVDRFSGEDLTHLGSVGRTGPGPGEYEFPIAFATLGSGGVAVADMMARNIVLYDPVMAYVEELGGFGQSGAPSNLAPGVGDSFVGSQMRIQPGEQGPEGSLLVGCWNPTDPEPATVYATFPVNVRSEDGGIRVEAPRIALATGPDGSVFVAESSDSVYLIRGFTSDGGELVTIEKDWERVGKTDEEIEDGALGLAISMESGTTSITRPRIEDVNPFRDAVSGLGVDASERLWVRVGSDEIPTFHVYDYQGELLFVARLEGLGRVAGRRAEFVIDSGGVLGFDPDPEDYPKVYLIELEQP
ncbi:hypothetical protein JW921_10535, partial [Candidatus Fermentibacterales bacterium]|nr:hypothetical protein [Candidatus Fermentibacterales bacterium]